MPHLTKFIPRDQRFKLNRVVLDSRVGDLYMRTRSAYAPFRAQPDADLVLDGFPRSANTYALFAAEEALGRGRVRGHTHAVGTLERGIALGLPTVLLVREPRAVVTSLVQLVEGVSIEWGFAAYTRFHQRLLDLKPSLHIAEFADVVDDFGNVMHDVNERFGTSMQVYQKTDENEAQVRRRIDESSAVKHGGRVREGGVARPSGHRLTADQVLADMDKNAERRWQQAEDAYAAILAQG